MEKVNLAATVANNQANVDNATSITRDEMLALYDRRRKELLALSKEELVSMIIGERWQVGHTYG